ncbi:MAG: glycosyltransferase WbuB [Planctomycetota bacterium]|nr:MAG: glycosyltransferase WbuB [Planctomycetota bacterium]REJ93650.1 MAG: glycosyltransferase WbuB [Planctomycetota bacterium]
MRVTILNRYYPPDLAPTGRLASDLAEELVRRGHGVSVIAGSDGYAPTQPAEPEAASQHVDVVRTWTPRLGRRNVLTTLLDFSAYLLGAAYLLFRRSRPDVVIVLTTPPWLVSLAVLNRMLRGSRVILWNMDLYPEVLEAVGAISPDGVISRALQWYNRRLFARVDEIVCLDEAMRERLRERYEGPGNQLPLRVIPNWESAGRLQSTAGELDAELKPLFADPSQFVVLYLGNAGRGHEFESVFEAAGRLTDKKITFLFVGGGQRRLQLEKAVRQARLDNFHFHDYVSTSCLSALLQSAALALITLRESARGVMSPSKLYTYLAAGLPVLYIGPVRTNVDEAIARFGCGRSLRNGDVAKVASTLTELHSDPRECERLQAASRLAYRDGYCDTQILPQLASLVESLADTGSHVENRRAA